MIRLTRQADYGILLLAEVASSPQGSVHAAPDLAAATGVPVPMVSKILKALARGGLLGSHRGSHGGYSLARPADEISIADVVTALEGPIAMTECTDGATEPSACRLESRCRVHQNWQKLNRVVVDALARVSLADMARDPAEPLVVLDLGRSTTLTGNRA